MYKIHFAVESSHPAGWTFFRKTPEYTTLSAVSEGVFNYSVEHNEYSVPAGSIILIPCGLSKKGRVPEKQNVTTYSLHFTGPLPEELDKDVPALLEGHLFPDLIHNFRSICRIRLLNEKHAELELTGNLFIILSRFVQYTKKYSTTLPDPRIQKVIQYITTHPEENVHVSSLAKETGISAAYMGSLFRQQTGKTIRNYANEMKIRKAIQLFSYPEMTISEIAYQCGFDDLFYFSKVFKQVSGLPPREYRKKH